jgi:hypothetical protein
VERNRNGSNVYMVGQPTRPVAGPRAKDADVTRIRVLYADGDTAALPTEWLVKPTFILVHPDTGRWWAYWVVTGVELADAPEYNKRIALHYDSDPKISNLSRLVRVAGFDRWKDGKNYGPYVLQETGGVTEARQHDGLPRLPAEGNATRTHGEKRRDYGELAEWDAVQAKRLVDAAYAGKLIKDYDGPFGEGERDNLTFQLFAEALNRGIHPGAILEEALATGIGGGLEDDVVQAKLASAYYDGNTQSEYCQKVDAYWLPNRVFKVYEDGKPVERPPADPVAWKAANLDQLPQRFPHDPQPANDDVPGNDDAPGDAETHWPDGLYDITEFGARPDADWIIRNALVCGSYSMSSGRKQTGKSTNELALALSVATGKPWLGHEIEKPGVVVYVVSEGAEMFADCVRGWCQHNSVDFASLKGRFYVYDGSTTLNTPEGRAKLDRLLKAIHQRHGAYPIAAWFDTVRKNMRGDVSKPDDAKGVLETVEEVRRLGIAVTLVAHHGRGHGETRGDTGWEDDAYHIRRYYGLPRDGTNTVEFAKNKNREDGRKVTIAYAKETLPSGVVVLVPKLFTPFPAADTPSLSDPAIIIRRLQAARSKASRMETEAPFSEIAAGANASGLTGLSSRSLHRKYHVGDAPFTATDATGLDWSITIEERPGNGGPAHWFVATRSYPNPTT